MAAGKEGVLIQKRRPRTSQGQRCNAIIADLQGTEKEPGEWMVLIIPFALFAIVPAVMMAVA